MNVLSLFDGMSGAMAALQSLGIKPDNYYACEIDKYSEAVSRFHYPNIIRLGDVRRVSFFGLPKIDLLVAGFPCQSFSLAGKQLNFDDPRGQLFFEVVRLIDELQPKFFILENVNMKKDIEAEINKLVGIKPIVINSALLSAQNRKRNYWVGGYKDGEVYQIDIQQPDDRGILLRDVIQEDVSNEYNITGAHLRYCTNEKHLKKKYSAINPNKSITLTARQYAAWNGNYLTIQQRARGYNKGGLFFDKSPTLSLNSWQDNNHLTDGLSIRKLTPVECERLQTFDDNFTQYGIINNKVVQISNSQRYKMLGNGFTRDVIAHIIQHIPAIDRFKNTSQDLLGVA